MGSKTGWGYESVGTVAQKLINEMIDGLRKINRWKEKI